MLEDDRMAKSTKKVTDTKKVETKAAAVKEASKTTAKKIEKAVEEPKKITTAKEAKKIETAKEPKKITAAKEPKKIAAKKEPEKIAAKPEPEKIETKKVEQLTLKDAAPAVKAEAKKATKKTAAKKADKGEAKAKAAPKKAAKAPAKKADTTTAVYQSLSVEDCIAKMQEMGVQHTYEDYKRLLLDEADTKVLENNIINGNELDSKGFTYEANGYDTGLVSVTLAKVMDTMDLKAADFKAIKKDMTTAIKAVYGEDMEKNASEYLKEFKACEKILMIAQRKNITDSKEVSKLLGADVDAFVEHFFNFAYQTLPAWQYDDVKFYEDFAYAVLSQYTDLYDKYQLNVLIDVADLYIKHGDFQHGDTCYGYILRDNQIKDYIYYRFAHIYEDFDMNKAKALAYESMQYVDGRFMYYDNLMEIINK